MLRRLVLAGLAGVIATPAALAQNTVDHPGRPIKLVVPFPPGGTSDLMGRLMAEELARQLRQPVVVDNRAGAGGAIGADQVAKAPPDGHTLLLSGIGSNAIIHGFQSPRPGYTEADFVHISQLAAGPNVLVVRHDFPARSFKELVAWIKAQPPGVSFGSPGAGTPHHLATELLLRQLGLKGNHVPYRGAAPALQDVAGGQLPFMLVESAGGMALIGSGRVRALAVSTAQRMKTLPEVPTLQEQGVKGFEAFAWQGLSAPAAAPAAHIARLNQALRAAQDSTFVKARFQALGVEVLSSTPEQMQRFALAERQRWGALIKELDLRLD